MLIKFSSSSSFSSSPFSSSSFYLCFMSPSPSVSVCLFTSSYYSLSFCDSFFSSSWHYDRQNIVRRSSRWPSSWHTSLAHTTVPLLPPPSPTPSPYKTWTPCSGLLAQCDAAETGTWYGLMAGGADTICFEGGFGLFGRQQF